MNDAGASRALLVDTSVAVALVVSDHDHHDRVREFVSGRTLGLAGHAAFETYSVLTRLPPPLRRTAGAAVRLLTENFLASRFLPVDGSRELLSRLADLDIAGGAVYDALVGATARHHGLALATRDRQALATYRALEVEVLVVG